jgi:DNA helicase IV
VSINATEQRRLRPPVMISEMPLDQLTPLQRQIVSAPLRGEIVVGGVAGSGKITVAVYRAAHLCATTPPHTHSPTVLFLCLNTALRDAIQRQISAMRILPSSEIPRA